jgi:hypothetical protein
LPAPEADGGRDVAVVAALCILALVLVVVAIITAPLRRRASASSSADPRHSRPLWLGNRSQAPDSADAALVLASADGASLSAAREAKYRELRDAELDWRTGKLARADYDAISATLQREALGILNAIEAIERGGAPPVQDGAAPLQTGAAPVGEGAAPGSDLQQQERVGEQQDREAHGPSVEVALDHGPATERAGAAADAKGAREARVLAGVHEHEQHEHHGDDNLK